MFAQGELLACLVDKRKLKARDRRGGHASEHFFSSFLSIKKNLGNRILFG
jgi:hypothetical protein